MNKVAAVIVLLLSGCATVPFPLTERVPVDQMDPGVVRTDFEASLPASYQLINSTVFRYRWHTQSAVGYLTVDQAQDRFALAAMTPMGVKLIELQGVGGVVECTYAIADFSEHMAEVASAIGLDIKHMYFNLVPSQNAAVLKTKTEIRYTDRTSTGVTEYLFAGQQLVLIEKKIYEQDELIRRVRYYAYESVGQKWVPGGILLDNRRHGYRLEVHLKEVMSMNSSEDL